MFKLERDTVIQVLDLKNSVINIAHEIIFDPKKEATKVTEIPPEVLENVAGKCTLIKRGEDYYVKSYEDLIVLLVEIKDYFSGATHEEKDSKETKIAELKSMVLEKIIEEANPYVTTGDWIEQSGSVALLHAYSQFNTDDKLRALLNAFDSVVNPFANNKGNMLKPIDYKEQNKIHCDLKDGTNLSIEDNETKTSLHYSRTSSRLSYNMYYEEGDTKICILHRYYNSHLSSDGDTLFINISDKDFCSECYFDITYFIKERTIEVGEKEFSRVTDEQTEKINQILSNAITVAERISLERMTREPGRLLTLEPKI